MGLMDRIPSVFAHRGGWGPALQNTLANLDAAARAGAHLEYDVWKTADNVLVVHHNAAIGSVTKFGREWGGVEIAKTAYADLPRLADGSLVPTAREVMELGKRYGRAHLVETKALGYERELLELADDVGIGAKQLYIQSFIPDSVRAVKELRPDIPAGLLGGSGRGHHPGLSSLEKAHEIGADYVLAQEKYINSAFLARADELGLPVVSWAPWKQADAVRNRQLLADARVDAVIANEREAAVAAAMDYGRP
jgi:glycerophosphoryl diester phosphodiesterase